MAHVQLPDASTVTTVDLARLNDRDGAETAKLVQAMEDPGYFYLDFRNAPATKFIADNARVLYALADEYFQQPADIKAKDLRHGLPSWSDRGFVTQPFISRAVLMLNDHWVPGTSRARRMRASR
jgi:hypothetical protein